ncbi:hypothetical protein SDC9_205335 [bioreactor metagenome]|uniref:Uncharacterized protein n=1 Tax=bioreactor metagenome TaxID=1076179 RepID=A0A645J223_9ZZZZ
MPGIVLTMTGFNADNAVQTDSALLGIRLLLAVFPAILVAVLYYIVSCYNLTDEQLIKYGKEIEMKNEKK